MKIICICTISLIKFDMTWFDHIIVITHRASNPFLLSPFPHNSKHTNLCSDSIWLHHFIDGSSRPVINVINSFSQITFPIKKKKNSVDPNKDFSSIVSVSHTNLINFSLLLLYSSSLAPQEIYVDSCIIISVAISIQSAQSSISNYHVYSRVSCKRTLITCY